MKAWVAASPENARRARDRAAQWRRDNPERANAGKRAWTAANPTKVAASIRRRTLSRLYAMTPAQWDAMFEAQGSCCAICRTADPGSGGRWHTDHDHTTGTVRGILCLRCNMGIGQFNDEPARLRAAAAYLEKT